MTLAPYVQILGRGPGRARSLTMDEAAEAMTLMLHADTPQAATGAILMLLRMKGETAEEIAGLAQAAQATLPPLPRADLDWPSYAAGRTRGAPWFLMAARQVAQSGKRVVIHGWNGADDAVRAGLPNAGITIARDPDAAARLLDRDNIVYLPLENLHPALFRLLQLREVLGLRSCVNTVCRMLNPAAALASVQGVFHPSYRLLQADAAKLLGWGNLSVIKGGGGEFERHPSKAVTAFGLRGGDAWEGEFAPLVDDTRRLAAPDDHRQTANWTRLTPDAFERAIISGTAAIARQTCLGDAAQAMPAA